MSHHRVDHRQSARILPFPNPSNGHTPRGEGMSATTLRTRTGTAATRPESTWTTIAGGRSTRRHDTTTRDGTTMNGLNLGIAHLYANARHADFLAEAERERTISSLRIRRGNGASEAIRAIRMAAGAALIRFGERLRGAEERCADLGSFRAARS